MEFRIFDRNFHLDDFDVENYLSLFDENNLYNYLQLLNLYENKFHDHDAESIELIEEFLLSKGEKWLYPLAVYITSGFNVDDYHEHYGGFFWNLNNNDQLIIVEKYILQILNDSEIMSPLNLAAIESLIEEGIKYKSEWIKGLNNVKTFLKQKEEYFLSSNNIELKDYLYFLSTSLMGMPWVFEDENINSLTFDEWRKNNEVMFKEYVIRSYEAYEKWVDKIIDSLR